MRLHSLIILLFLTGSISCSGLAQAAEPEEPLIATKQLYLRVSLGAGVMTNPLHKADNLPLVLLPQVAYYGEQWFFDNGRLGYAALQTAKHNLSLVTELNTESRFFIDWHPKNILILQNISSNKQVGPIAGSSAKKIGFNNIHKRKMALDAGMSYSYVAKRHVLSVQALHDVTSVYNGWRAAIQWQYHAQIDRLQLRPSLGVSYKSAQLNDYFYGLNSDETSLGEIVIGSSWQPYAKIDARWALSKANALRFHLAYFDYSAVDSSPLFERHYSTTAFIGFEHTF